MILHPIADADLPPMSDESNADHDDAQQGSTADSVSGTENVQMAPSSAIAGVENDGKISGWGDDSFAGHLENHDGNEDMF